MIDLTRQNHLPWACRKRTVKGMCRSICISLISTLAPLFLQLHGFFRHPLREDAVGRVQSPPSPSLPPPLRARCVSCDPPCSDPTTSANQLALIDEAGSPFGLPKYFVLMLAIAADPLLVSGHFWRSQRPHLGTHVSQPVR